MKYVKFYLEYPNKTECHKATRKNLGKHEGNVVAVFDRPEDWYGDLECLSAVYFYSNSPVASSSVGYEYLRERCKRISEEQARKIHPELFKRLDMED